MEITEELKPILEQYRKIEQELENLEQRKQTLRTRIQGVLDGKGQTFHSQMVNGEPMILVLKQHTEIRYNEEILRRRLGNEYVSILKPDLKKIKTHLQEITPALLPYLEKIGTPSRETIKYLIGEGKLEQQQFQGAFEKTMKTTLFVKKQPVL